MADFSYPAAEQARTGQRATGTPPQPGAGCTTPFVAGRLVEAVTSTQHVWPIPCLEPASGTRRLRNWCTSQYTLGHSGVSARVDRWP